MRVLTSRLAMVLIAVAVVGAVGAFGASRLFAATPKPELRTANVQRGNVTQTVSVSGSVNASSQVRVAFKSGGRLAALLVSVGQKVNAGDLLAKLDDADQKVSLQQATANLNAAQAKYRATLNGDDLAALRMSVDQAQQALNRLVANYAAAKANLDSIFNAAKQYRAAAETTFQNAQTTVLTLQADLAVANQYADVKTATTTSNTVQANLQQAQAQLFLVDAALNDLQSAGGAIHDQIAKADAGAPDPQAYGAAQSVYSAALSRAQLAIDTANGPLSTAVTNTNNIIANLNTTLTKPDTSVVPARNDAITLVQQLSTTQQQLTLAKSKLGSLTTPLGTIGDAVTGATIANAQNSLANGKQSLQTKLNNRDSDVQGALSTLQSAQASYDNARNTLANLSLTAPAGGVVTQINGQVGEFVSGGSSSSPFIVLSNTGGLALHGTIGEADVARLKPGQVATLTIDAVGADKRFTGKVTNLDPAATIQQGVPVYGVDVTLDVGDDSIRPGMSGTANVIVASKRDVLVVPNTAIRSLSGRRGVQVMKDGQPADVTDVQFGISNDQVTEVTSGLAEGDLLILPTARSSTSQQPGGGIRIPGVGGGGVPGR